MTDIEKIVLEALSEIGEDSDNEALINADENTKLLGGNGHLDSLGVVLLVSELEGVISEKFEKSIVLADDRAMSQRTSPFRSVNTLCSYIDTLLAEENA